MIFQTPAIWLFEEDVKTRSWWDWLTAHTSFLLPLHRYRGKLFIMDDHLELQGRDKRTKEEVMLYISKYSLEQVHLGFDEVFSLAETRGLGLSWQPLRIRYDASGETRTLYLIANYRISRSDNAKLFDFLKTWTGQ